MTRRYRCANDRAMAARRRTNRLLGAAALLGAVALVQNETVSAWAHENALSMDRRGQDAASIAFSVGTGIEQNAMFDNAGAPEQITFEPHGSMCVVPQAQVEVDCRARIVYIRTSPATFSLDVTSASGNTASFSGEVS